VLVVVPDKETTVKVYAVFWRRFGTSTKVEVEVNVDVP
jgi:hypothetical protein